MFLTKIFDVYMLVYYKTKNYYVNWGRSNPYEHQLIGKSTDISLAHPTPIITLLFILNTKQEVHVERNFTILIHFP